ncbi:MAG TPA: hypothetical protein VED46_18175 [Alphaproteobacteria bacterium]|nr:hypothetical protein [Alphaproteobacteria bacterium]
MRLDRQEIEAALSLLLDEMEGEQGPSHEVYLRLVQILDSMRATGMPLPEDLVALERDLAAEFEKKVKPRTARARSKTTADRSDQGSS